MRLFLPQFQEYRMLQSADRALNVESMDEAFEKLAALINGNLDSSNLSKTASFPATAFLEPNSLITFKAVHPELRTPGAPTNMILGTIPAILNGIQLVPVGVSAILFYSTAPVSVPTYTLAVGATTVASGSTVLLESVTSPVKPPPKTVSPQVWWKFGEGYDPLENYGDDPPPSTAVKYKVFSNFFVGGTTPSTGNLIVATISPATPDLDSYFSITFKVRHVS